VSNRLTHDGRWSVQGYPTIFAFRSGVKEAYEGPREAAGILAWIDEQGPAGFDMLSTVAELDAFVTQHEVAVVAVVRPPLPASKIFAAVKSLAKQVLPADSDVDECLARVALGAGCNRD
jgi:hypothetical protein